MDNEINTRWKNAVIKNVLNGFYSKGDVDMKLTNFDKEVLHDWGYDDSDISQIERAIQIRYTTYELEGVSISRSKAIELLGRETFLSGISRSAFHCTASRQTESGDIILFDSSKLFQS